MTDARAHSPLAFAFMALGIVAAIIVAVAMVMLSEKAELPFDHAKGNPVAPPEFGVVGTIISNGASQEYRAATLNLQVEPGANHDVKIPAGPFEGQFTITFDRGRVQYARIGAEIQGGSVILMRGEEVLLSEYASPESAKLVLTRFPFQLSRRREQITYIFRADTERPVKLRAMWQPEDADQPRPLPGGTS